MIASSTHAPGARVLRELGCILVVFDGGGDDLSSFNSSSLMYMISGMVICILLIFVR